jgi:AsmA protein
LNQNSANLQNLAVSVGQTNTSGQLTIKNFAAPQVQFALNADKVDVVELQGLTATPAAPAKRADSGGFWQVTPQAEAQTQANTNAEPGIITKMTGNGTVAIGTITDKDLILSNVHSNVTLDHGVIRLNPLTADVYNGKENGTVTIDLRPAQPVYNVNLKTERVDANKLISSVSDLKQTLYGLLSSNVNASFSSSSADAIARSLNGTMAIDLSNGKLMNVDLLHELATVGKFLGSAVPSAPKGFTNLTSLTGNFDVKNGLAQTNNLKAVIDGGTLAATGLVNLADHSLNMKMTAVLNKALSQQVGGNQVGGFMNTALANNQGELVLPVLVTGTFQHPQVTPDVQQIAQMKLHNLLPTSSNPGQLTTGILGKVLGGNQGQNAGAGAGQGGAQGQGGTKAPGQGGAQGAINGVLGALGAEQQKQQPAQAAPPSSTAVPAPSSATTAPSSTTAAPASTTAAPDSTPAAAPASSPAASPQSAQDTINGILGQVLKGKKKATPTPTPQ